MKTRRSSRQKRNTVENVDYAGGSKKAETPVSAQDEAQSPTRDVAVRRRREPEPEPTDENPPAPSPDGSEGPAEQDVMDIDDDGEADEVDEAYNSSDDGGDFDDVETGEAEEDTREPATPGSRGISGRVTRSAQRRPRVAASSSRRKDAEGDDTGNDTAAAAKGDSNPGEIKAYLAETINKSLRMYAGPLQRHDRFGLLLYTIYGPQASDIAIADGLRNHWVNTVLPRRGVASKDRKGGVLQSPWLPADFEKVQATIMDAWLGRYRLDKAAGQQARFMSTPPAAAEDYGGGDLATFLGPYDRQRQEVLSDGKAISLSPTWEAAVEAEAGAVPDESTIPAGWLLDVGGIPLAMGWAPLMTGSDQILALAVVPHSDHAYYHSEKAMPRDNKKTGTVQLWRFRSKTGPNGVRRPSARTPQRIGVIRFDWGRAKRMQWCPVPVERDSIFGVLAVLCDGQVHIIEAREPPDGADGGGTTATDWIDTPITSLGSTEEEPSGTATCFTWVGINRVALGHRDGSITLWSVHPRMLLQRQTVHYTYVLDVCSGYPSHPYLVASLPVGGCPTVVDLTQPSAETASHTTPSLNFQPNLLCWSDHMQGFITTYPNSTPGATGAAFLHAQFFPQPRTIFQGFSQPTCLAVGHSHPFALIGCADGSLWAFNAFRKVFFMRDERLYKLKIFQHEFRRAPKPQPPVVGAAAQAGGQAAQCAAFRGAVRFLHGFRPEINDNQRNDYTRALSKTAREKKKLRAKARVGKPKGKRKRKRTDQSSQDDVQDDDDGDVDGDGDGDMDVDGGEGGYREVDEGDEGDDPPDDHNPIKAIILHEAETRVITVSWNPNLDHGWWAAAALGSGLVRVMDLGLD